MASASDEAAFLAELEAMNREYVLAMPARFAAMTAAWAAVQRGEAAALQALVKDAHYLAGTGATFGQPPISTAAGALEALLWPLAKSGALPGVEAAKAIAWQMASLNAAVEAAA